MQARRALLYMPGDDMRKIIKATTLQVDTICMDLEDSVAINRKAEARRIIAEALGTLDFGKSEKLARINPVGSGLEMEDLRMVIPARPDGIVIPKVESARQVQWASEQIQKLEEAAALPAGEIILIVIVETARGIINLQEIASSDPRLQAMIFGADDYAGSIGATRTKAGWEVFYARSAVVAHASAFNLQAIDMVYIDLKDIEGLKLEASQGASMGYTGKQIIHPNQVIPVQEAFTPDQTTIEQAQKIIKSYEEHQEMGTGAFAYDGIMVDAPMIKSAQRVLERARVGGKI